MAYPNYTPKTTVVNIREAKEYDVYIGRAVPRRGIKGSIWGNPFEIGRDGTREEVIAKYRAWIMTQPQLLEQVGSLHGKTLACWCAPKACHGDVLAELASTPPPPATAPAPEATQPQEQGR